MEEPIQSKGSFTDCSRLYALQGALAQQEWRIPPLMDRILKDLKPFLTHSFMNVRNRIGSMLTTVFISDLDFGHFPGNTDGLQGGNHRNPKVLDFINEVVPQLEILASSEDSEEPPLEAEKNQNGAEMMMMPTPEMMARMPLPPPEMMARMPMLPPEMMARMRMPPPEMMARMRMPPPEMMARMRMPPPEMMLPPGMGMPHGMPDPMMFDPASHPMMEMTSQTNGIILDPEKEEKQKAIRLFQAVCKCIGGCLERDIRGIRPEYYKLLPMLCNQESNDIEVHLAKDCSYVLSQMAQCVLPKHVIPACLDAMSQVSKSESWRSRASVLELLQVRKTIRNSNNRLFQTELSIGEFCTTAQSGT